MAEQMEKTEKEERTLISFDWALKSILRQKDNFDILEGFLTDLLGEEITIMELLESESNKGDEQDKFNRVDLKAKDGSGREIIIEIQHDSEPDYLERVYYGTSKSIIDNLQEGYKYKHVKKIISVSIVYWQLLGRSYLIKGEMGFRDMVSNEAVDIKGKHKIFAEYYFIQPEWFGDEIKSKIDEWVYMFKHSKVKGTIEATNIGKLQNKLNKIQMTHEERVAYDAYQLNRTINEGVLQEREDKGIRKGIQQGIQQGIEQGIGQRQQQMVNAMRESGMSESEIEKILKLSEKV